jgi:hypothetical protein
MSASDALEVISGLADKFNNMAAQLAIWSEQ